MSEHCPRCQSDLPSDLLGCIECEALDLLEEVEKIGMDEIGICLWSFECPASKAQAHLPDCRWLRLMKRTKRA